MSSPKRIQRQRTKGWRMPEGAVYVGRPSPWGNPFPVDGPRQPWMALAFGQRGDLAGRRASAVIGHRWWIEGGDTTKFPVALAPDDAPGGEVEYTSGRVAKIADLATGLGLSLFLSEPLVLPTRPDLAPLRGHDLACWCPLDQPCHADVLLELANA